MMVPSFLSNVKGNVKITVKRGVRAVLLAVAFSVHNSLAAIVKPSQSVKRIPRSRTYSSWSRVLLPTTTPVIPGGRLPACPMPLKSRKRPRKGREAARIWPCCPQAYLSLALLQPSGSCAGGCSTRSPPRPRNSPTGMRSTTCSAFWHCESRTSVTYFTSVKDHLGNHHGIPSSGSRHLVESDRESKPPNFRPRSPNLWVVL